MRHLRNKIKNPEFVRMKIVAENIGLDDYFEFLKWCKCSGYNMIRTDTQNENIVEYQFNAKGKTLYIDYLTGNFQKLFDLIDYFFQPNQPTYYFIYFTDYEFIRANCHLDIQEYFISNDYGQKYFKNVWGYWSYDNCGETLETEPVTKRYGLGKTGVYIDFDDEKNDETKLHVKYYTDERYIFDEELKSPFWKHGQWDNVIQNRIHDNRKDNCR